MLSKIKDAGIFLLLLAIVAYAMYRSEQTIAGIALILLAVTSYKNMVKPFVARAEAFARRLDYAKFRDVELRADRQAAELERLDGLQLTLIQDSILRNLEPDLYGVLVNLNATNITRLDRSHIEHFRQLRDYGLLAHDQPRLRDSETIWLTPLGRQVAEVLAQPNKKPDLGDRVPRPTKLTTTPDSQTAEYASE